MVGKDPLYTPCKHSLIRKAGFIATRLDHNSFQSFQFHKHIVDYVRFSLATSVTLIHSSVPEMEGILEKYSPLKS